MSLLGWCMDQRVSCLLPPFRRLVEAIMHTSDSVEVLHMLPEATHSLKRGRAKQTALNPGALGRLASSICSGSVHRSLCCGGPMQHVA